MDSCVLCKSTLRMGVRGYGCTRCYITYTEGEMHDANDHVYYTYHKNKVLIIGSSQGTECLNWCKHYDGTMEIVDYVVFPEFQRIPDPIEAIQGVFRKCDAHTLIILRSNPADRGGIGYTVYGVKRLCDLLKLYVVHVNAEACVFVVSFNESCETNMYDVLYSQLEDYSTF